MVTSGTVDARLGLEKLMSIIMSLVLAGVFAYFITRVGIITENMNKSSREL